MLDIKTHGRIKALNSISFHTIINNGEIYWGRIFMRTKHYFACGNTAKGFHNFFRNNIELLTKIFILKGGPGTGKSTLMKKLGKN